MKEKVYLDSSIPSYYFDERESLASFIEVTKSWWSEMSCFDDVFISDAVLEELSEGNYPIRVINGRLGLSTPEIITPLELFKEKQDND